VHKDNNNSEQTVGQASKATRDALITISDRLSYHIIDVTALNEDCVPPCCQLADVMRHSLVQWNVITWLHGRHMSHAHTHALLWMVGRHYSLDGTAGAAASYMSTMYEWMNDVCWILTATRLSTARMLQVLQSARPRPEQSSPGVLVFTDSSFNSENKFAQGSRQGCHTLWNKTV